MCRVESCGKNSAPFLETCINLGAVVWPPLNEPKSRDKLRSQHYFPAKMFCDENNPFTRRNPSLSVGYVPDGLSPLMSPLTQAKRFRDLYSNKMWHCRCKLTNPTCRIFPVNLLSQCLASVWGRALHGHGFRSSH
jgi:hypothetical protein